MQPQVLRANQTIVTLGPKRLVLASTDLVEGFVHVPDDVEPVEHDLLVGVVDDRAQLLDVRLPHVHRDRLDMSEVVDGVTPETASDALLGAILGEVDHVATVEIAHHGRVALSFCQRLLVDSKMPRHLVRSTRHSTRHRALHDVVCFVPCDAEHRRRTGDAGLEQHVDRETLEQRREPRLRLRPRHSHLTHTVLAAVHARDACVQMGLKPATVEVPPGSLLIVVVQTTRLRAFRAGPLLRLLVLREHVDSLLGDVQLYAVNDPRLLKTEKLSVQIGVTHARG